MTLPKRDTVETIHQRSLDAGWRVYVPSAVTDWSWTFMGKLGCTLEDVRRVAQAWDLDIDVARKSVHCYGPLGVPPGLLAGDARALLPSPRALESGA